MRQFNEQILTLSIHLVSTGKLGTALFLLEMSTRENATLYKEVLHLNYRYHTLINGEVGELSTESKIKNCNKIAFSTINLVLEHIKKNYSSNFIN